MTAQPEDNDTPDMTPEERAEYLAAFYPDGDVIDLRDEISAAKKGIQSATEGGRHDDVEKFEGRRLGREQQLKDLLSERRMHGLALVPETAPTPAPAAPVVAESWHLKKPERAHGYTWELYSALKAARDAGKTCPKPREVLDSWQAIKPLNITEVMSNEFKYLDSNGEIKTADLKALRKAIERMTSAR